VAGSDTRARPRCPPPQGDVAVRERLGQRDPHRVIVAYIAIAAFAEAGELPGRRIGGDWRFPRAALLKWLAAR
jgi:hypothetical protein